MNYEKAWKELEKEIAQKIQSGKTAMDLPTLLIVQGSMSFIEAKYKNDEEV